MLETEVEEVPTMIEAPRTAQDQPLEPQSTKIIQSILGGLEPRSVELVAVVQLEEEEEFINDVADQVTDNQGLEVQTSL